MYTHCIKRRFHNDSGRASFLCSMHIPCSLRLRQSLGIEEDFSSNRSSNETNWESGVCVHGHDNTFSVFGIANSEVFERILVETTSMHVFFTGATGEVIPQSIQQLLIEGFKLNWLRLSFCKCHIVNFRMMLLDKSFSLMVIDLIDFLDQLCKRPLFSARWIMTIV